MGGGITSWIDPTGGLGAVTGSGGGLISGDINAIDPIGSSIGVSPEAVVDAVAPVVEATYGALMPGVADVVHGNVPGYSWYNDPKGTAGGLITGGAYGNVGGDMGKLIDGAAMSLLTGGGSNIYAASKQNNWADQLDTVIDDTRVYDRGIRASGKWTGDTFGKDVQSAIGNYVVPIVGSMFGPAGSAAGAYMGNKFMDRSNEQGAKNALIAFGGSVVGAGVSAGVSSAVGPTVGPVAGQVVGQAAGGAASGAMNAAATNRDVGTGAWQGAATGAVGGLVSPTTNYLTQQGINAGMNPAIAEIVSHAMTGMGRDAIVNAGIRGGSIEDALISGAISGGSAGLQDAYDKGTFDGGQRLSIRDAIAKGYSYPELRGAGFSDQQIMSDLNPTTFDKMTPTGGKVLSELGKYAGAVGTGQDPLKSGLRTGLVLGSPAINYGIDQLSHAINGGPNEEDPYGLGWGFDFEKYAPMVASFLGQKLSPDEQWKATNQAMSPIYKKANTGWGDPAVDSEINSRVNGMGVGRVRPDWMSETGSLIATNTISPEVAALLSNIDPALLSNIDPALLQDQYSLDTLLASASKDYLKDFEGSHGGRKVNEDPYASELDQYFSSKDDLKPRTKRNYLA